VSRIEVKVPDLGDFKDVPVIEVLVKAGDRVRKDDPLITLESDKATMEVPASDAGVVQELRVKLGDKVSQGKIILVLDAEAPAAPAAPPAVVAAAPSAAVPAPSSGTRAEVLVLGSGPGGYTAAFRAADLGKKVTLVERYPTLGGVCLNVGCIPSKALLHAAKVITEADEMRAHGIDFGPPRIDFDKLKEWKGKVVKRLTDGLASLAKQRGVSVVRGVGRFTSANTLEVENAGDRRELAFEQCIIAAGSAITRIPGFPYDDPRLLDSTSALELPARGRMLVIGGGIIGLEMATVYDALGCKISVVELTDGLIPGCDRDLVRPLAKRIEKRYEAIYLSTKVAAVEPTASGLRVSFEGKEAPTPQLYDYVLLAVGRRPNGKSINAEAAGVHVDQRGFITVDRQQRSNVPHIFAIGDICGEPMLAHKATHEGKVAAEVIAGHKVAFDAHAIPSVAYTDPEVAWMGLTESQAKAQGIEIQKALFPWAASGRALGVGRDEGQTKLILDKATRRVLGAGIVGVNAGELIAETVLALELGAEAEDIGLSIHPHPTLSETVAFAAEIATGSITDLYIKR
jgi:dihydrolipoamide dehydrogenase